MDRMRSIVPTWRSAFKNPHLFQNIEETCKRLEAWREKRRLIHGGDAANDGTGEIRCEGYLELRSWKISGSGCCVGISAAAGQAHGPARPNRQRAFWTCDSHAVASGRLGRVERRVGLLKKFFHGPVTPLLAHQ